jgi:hypothetical protein
MAIRSEDHLTTEHAQADRSLYHVGRVARRPSAHYEASIGRRISCAGSPRAECGSAVPIQMPYVIQHEGDSRRNTNIRTFSSDEASFLNQEPFEVRATLNPRGY